MSFFSALRSCRLPSSEKWSIFFLVSNRRMFGNLCTKKLFFSDILIDSEIFNKKNLQEMFLLETKKFLENWPKCHHQWPNYWVLLRFCSRLEWNAFQKIQIKWKKVSLKKKFDRIFILLKIIWNVCKKNFIKSGAKKNSIRTVSQLMTSKPPLPSPQFWSHFHVRCAMCWNEWKNNLGYS